MKSPITGKEMKLCRENRVITFRKEEIEVLYRFYLCEDSGERFTTEELDEINLIQVYNKYRAKHKIPFPEQIRETREKYGLSAALMSEVLGFGVNSYRNYENGEVPNLSNGRLIQLASDPRKFQEMVEGLDGSHPRKEDLLRKMKVAISKYDEHCGLQCIESYFFRDTLPNEYNGFRKPSKDRIVAIINFFGDRLSPWITVLNKLLFYADFLTYNITGYSMSGIRYRAIQLGPVPSNYKGLFEYLDVNDLISIEVKEFSDGNGERVIGIHPANMELFTPLEIRILNNVTAFFKDKTTKEVIDISHLEPAWKDNEAERRDINYSYAFQLATNPNII